MSLAIVLAPSADDRIDLLDQLRHTHRSLSQSSLPNLILEMLDGLLARIRVEVSRTDTATDLAGW